MHLAIETVDPWWSERGIAPVWLERDAGGRLRHYDPDTRDWTLAIYCHASDTARSFGYSGA